MFVGARGFSAVLLVVFHPFDGTKHSSPLQVAKGVCGCVFRGILYRILQGMTTQNGAAA
jgi:hypothetical protein